LPFQYTAGRDIANEAAAIRRLKSAEGVATMMAAVFATLLLAFVLDFLGRARLAICCLALSFGLGAALFLWEIYSPDYGFRMPWLQVETDGVGGPHWAAYGAAS
jgi:hypothetical protein